MSKVTVYKFQIYDGQSDAMHTSRRFGTREAIATIKGYLLEDTAVEIDEEHVKADSLYGLTVRDFNPSPRVGFQTQVY